MQTANTGQLAGLGSRFLALLIDGIILAVIGFIINSIIGGAQVTTSPTGAAFAINTTGSLINLIVGLAYYIVLLPMWNGQTVGKRLMRVRVVKTDGGSITIATAVIRYIGYIINSLVIFIGWIWAFFDSQKQGWHDKIAGTLVVKA
jgi:uncharacterized RDD family membrane protein YckC